MHSLDLLGSFTCLIILITEVVCRPLHSSSDATAFTSIPNGPTAASWPKRTGIAPSKTNMDASVTPKPLEKRVTIDPAVYMTAVQSLYDEYAEKPGTSLASEIKSYLSNNSPSGGDAEIQSSLSSIVSAGENKLAAITSAFADGWNPFQGLGDDVGDLASGVISANGGTTYWSLSDYISTWAAMDTSAQDTWRTKNNYVGTYTDHPATSFSPGVMRPEGNTTWWISSAYMATINSLASIDSGMAQISWTRNNIYSGGTSITVATSNPKAGLPVQMNTIAEAYATSIPTSVQSGNTTGVATTGGSGITSQHYTSNIPAGNQAAVSANATSQVSTNGLAVATGNAAASQQNGVNAFAATFAKLAIHTVNPFS